MFVFRVVSGVLYLVDLAGRESGAKSGMTGDGQKEADAINNDLLELRRVLIAIYHKV